MQGRVGERMVGGTQYHFGLHLYVSPPQRFYDLQQKNLGWDISADNISILMPSFTPWMEGDKGDLAVT